MRYQAALRPDVGKRPESNIAFPLKQFREPFSFVFLCHSDERSEKESQTEALRPQPAPGDKANETGAKLCLTELAISLTDC